MKLIVFLSVFVLVDQVLADTFFVAPVSGYISDQVSADGRSRRSKEVKSTYVSLIKASLAERGHSVVENQESAEWTLKPSAMRLDEAYVLSLVKQQKGKFVFSSKLKATTFSDSDVVTDRLVQAVVTEKAVAQTQTVDKVTQDETRGTTVKTKALRQIFFGFGPGAVTQVNGAGSGFFYTLGYLWGLDHQVSLRLNLEGVSVKETDASAWFIGLGSNYYFNRNKHTPYVLGMLTYGGAAAVVPASGNFCVFNCTTERGSGFGASVGGGMHFYRTSNVNFAIEASYNQGFYKVAGDTPGFYGVKIKILW